MDGIIQLRVPRTQSKRREASSHQPHTATAHHSSLITHQTLPTRHKLIAPPRSLQRFSRLLNMNHSLFTNHSFRIANISLHPHDLPTTINHFLLTPTATHLSLPLPTTHCLSPSLQTTVLLTAYCLLLTTYCWLLFTPHVQHVRRSSVHSDAVARRASRAQPNRV